MSEVKNKLNKETLNYIRAVYCTHPLIIDTVDKIEELLQVQEKYDALLDRVNHDRMSDALAAATTHEEVAEIQAGCRHWYKKMSHVCWICGHEQTIEELEEQGND